MGREIRVIHYGVGPIGAGIARLLLEKPNVRIVGAIDIDPAKVGQDLGFLIGSGRGLGVTISDRLNSVLRTGADVVVHCTSSRLCDVEEQLFQCIDSRISVVSTCEELVYPFHRYPELSDRLDRAARAGRVAILGAGVNPGFLMDRLVLTLASACQRVDTITAKRIVDAKERRLPLQKKVGAGLSPDEFSARVASGEIKHHGLPESIAMIADSLDLRLEEIQETIEPAIADAEVCTEFLKVQPGEVAGIKQTARGRKGDKEIIRLELDIYVGASEPRDEVQIGGLPDLHCSFPGGLHGDLATAAIVVNSISPLLEAAPGLRTLRDLPVSYFTGRASGECFPRRSEGRRVGRIPLVGGGG